MADEGEEEGRERWTEQRDDATLLQSGAVRVEAEREAG